MGRKDMVEKTGGIIIEEGESVASQRSASLSGPNGNRVGTRQLPSVREPTLDEPEADGVNTAHEDEGQEAKTLPLLRASDRSAASCSPSSASYS